MPDHILSFDTISGGNTVFLERGENVYVRAGVLVASTDFIAIASNEGGNTYVIEGDVVGSEDGIEAGEHLTDQPEPGGDVVIVRAAASVTALDSPWGIGVEVESFASLMTNAGTIYGRNTGVEMSGVNNDDTGVTTSTLRNTGTIEGGVSGVSRGILHETNETLIFKNYGTVEGEQFSFLSSPADAPDIIYNDGRLIGDVELGLGEDSYDGSGGGRIEGVVHGGDGSDTLIAGDRGDALDGGADFDSITGGKGDDTLSGGEGGDFLFGEAGDDVLEGDPANNNGIDEMYGGSGDDRYLVHSKFDYVEELAKGGLDTIESFMSFSLKGIDNVENLRLRDGFDVFKATGNELGNLIIGNVNGNMLAGGGGMDTLTGGGGFDSYVFDTKLDARHNVDLITSFSITSTLHETVRLDHSIFKGLSKGELDADAFLASKTGRPEDAQDRIVYDTKTGELFYDADGNHKGEATLFAVVGGHPHLTAEDFLIF